MQTTITRHPLNFYESPSWFTTEMLKYVPLSGVIGEPCVGGGAIASLLQYCPNTQIWTNDIDPNKSADYHYDATLSKSWEYLPDCDWVVTNPPYSDHAAPIIINAHKKARVGVVAFLLTSFLEPCGDRASFLENYPPSLVLIYPRFCFRKNKAGTRWATDNGTISCFVWDKRDTQQRVIVRPADKIVGFYKNPDKAISQESVLNILQLINNERTTNIIQQSNGVGAA